jgi:hypothetical protein
MRPGRQVAASIDLPERTGYRVKRALLGPPLVTAALHEERLSKKAALGVLSSDCISSSAYGSEEMLIWLLPIFGLAGFHILLPMTAVVIAVLVIMTLLYREVVMVYTRAGGSYVVARENFGPKIAQIASVALLIDYVVTVAVQSAAGTAAITSLAPSLKEATTEITVAVVLLLAYGNLRGIREAGKAFAFPTYFFVVMAGLAVIVGIIREIFGDLPRYGHTPGMIATVAWTQRVTVEGRIKVVQVGTTAGRSLEAQVFDDSGGIRLLFFGRTRIPGIVPGAVIRATGTVGEYKGHPALANPRYELLAPEGTSSGRSGRPATR